LKKNYSSLIKNNNQKPKQTMKKILVIAACAFMLASCCSKEAGICVDKFYESPVIGTEVIISGQADLCCCSGALLIVGSEKRAITVAPVEGVAVPEKVKGATISVKGIVSSETIDEVYVAALVEKAEAAQDSTEKAGLAAKAEKVREAITANNGPITKYTIAATSIEVTKCCKKDGKEGCAKDGKKCCAKDGKEGSEKKCEAAKDSVAKEGCAGAPADEKTEKAAE
jgi:hypothetical protein